MRITSSLREREVSAKLKTNLAQVHRCDGEKRITSRIKTETQLEDSGKEAEKGREQEGQKERKEVPGKQTLIQSGEGGQESRPDHPFEERLRRAN